MKCDNHQPPPLFPLAGVARTKKFAANDRVMCRATRFDDGVDGQGREWSDNHCRKTKSRWAVGTVKRLLVSEQVKVKWDDEARQRESEGLRPEPCIRGSGPSMHAPPYEARQSQAKARAMA